LGPGIRSLRSKEATSKETPVNFGRTSFGAPVILTNSWLKTRCLHHFRDGLVNLTCGIHHLDASRFFGVTPVTTAPIGSGSVMPGIRIVFNMGLVGTLGFAYGLCGNIFDEHGMKTSMPVVGRQIMDTAHCRT
jgi:hypothetical protein